MRIGRWRTGTAAAVGWLAGLIAGAIALGPKHSHPLLIIPITVFFGVLTSLPIAIVLDLVARGRPDRRRGRRTLLHPVRALRRALAPLGRLRELVGNARRENLLHVRYRNPAALASPDLARRVRLVLERSGGMFVKFGQIAATRTDLLPETMTTELSQLHMNVARVAPDEIMTVMLTELGEPVEQAFASFDREPLAAASIGQTHRATLHDGRRVVVKVQRPGIDELVRRDAAVLSFVAGQLDRRVDAARRIGVRGLAEELIEGIEEELDYGHELAAGIRLREAGGYNGAVQIPLVHPTLSSDRLLVMDEVIGRSISDAAAIDATPVTRPELARRLLESFLTQILRDGYYHADPHPGNVLIDAEGTLWLLDFGAIGRIDPVTRDALRGIAIGFSQRDGSLLARAVRHLVGDDRLDMRRLERDLTALLGEVQEGGLSAAAMLGMMDVMQNHGLAPPRPMVLLSRTLVTLEGTLKGISPGFDLASEAELLVSADGFVGFDNPNDLLRSELMRALPALRTLPEHMEALALQWRTGRLVLRTERYFGSDRAVLEGWLNRVLVMAAGGAGALTSAVLLAAAGLAADKGVRDALWSLGFFGLTAATVLLFRTVAQALHAQSTEVEAGAGGVSGPVAR